MSNFVKAAVAAIIASSAVAQAQAEDIKVGLLLPFSGVYAALGEEIETGFRLGLELALAQTCTVGGKVGIGGRGRGQR